MKQNTYQLEFDIPQAGFNAIRCDITQVKDNLTFAENFMDVPKKE